MPLCKWTAFPSSWFSARFSCKWKSELRKEGEHDLQCLHLSGVWDAFFKREGQTANHLRFTLVCQSGTGNWPPLHTQTSFGYKTSLKNSRVWAFLSPLWEFLFGVLPGNSPEQILLPVLMPLILHFLSVKPESMETNLWKETNQNSGIIWCENFSHALPTGLSF